MLFPALQLACSGCDAPGKEQKGKSEGHKVSRGLEVRAAAFSPDAKLLAVAIGPPAPFRKAIVLEQRTIQLWEVESGKLLHTFQVDKPAEALFFGQNGKKLLACHLDKVTIFDVAAGTKDSHNQLGGIPLAMLPDGKKILLYSWIDNEPDRVLELWDPFTPKLLKKFSGTTYPRGGAAISPDGKWALVPCIPHQAKPGPLDPTVLQIWELSKGEIKHSLVGIPKGDATSYEIWDAKGKLKTSLRMSDANE
jgi:WD40 repeat protein